MEIGLLTFADVARDINGSLGAASALRMRHLLEEMELAEQAGLDVFALGEHHRADYVVSAPAVVLAAGAVRTQRIRLASGVTVLSSDDPVRVYQQFASLDLLSNGRAEIMAGRGSFLESYPLFGYDLADYDALFAEKLDLLLRIRAGEKVTWAGRHRAPLKDLGVYPRALQEELPIWIAVGGNANSVARAGALGLPLVIAIIGGTPDRFVGLTQLYRQAGSRAGHDASKLKLAISSIGFVADTTREAADQFFPSYAAMMTTIGRERGWSPMTREQFDALRSPPGALVVGSPDEVIDKLLYEHELFGHQRLLLQMSVGTMPHAQVMHAIELLGTKVAPAVRKAVGERANARVTEP